MLVTLGGIATDTSPVQPYKAPSPMLFTPGNIFTSVIVLYALGNVEDNFFTHEGIVTDTNPLQL